VLIPFIRRKPGVLTPDAQTSATSVIFKGFVPEGRIVKSSTPSAFSDFLAIRFAIFASVLVFGDPDRYRNAGPSFYRGSDSAPVNSSNHNA
jgi:hypothetical protein